jgi:hypothetical protein
MMMMIIIIIMMKTQNLGLVINKNGKEQRYTRSVTK